MSKRYDLDHSILLQYLKLLHHALDKYSRGSVLNQIDTLNGKKSIENVTKEASKC